MVESTPEVIVVGAGPVGLFTALLLARRGVRVRVLDRSPGPPENPRAAVIWPRAAEALRAEGLSPAFHAESSFLRSADFFIRGRQRGHVSLGALDSPEPLPWIVEQHRTEAILRDALRANGVEVEWGVEVLRAESGQGSARLSARTGNQTLTLEASWIVAADGARSQLRKGLGIPFEGAERPGLECLQINAVPHWRYPTELGRCQFFLDDRVTLLAVPLPTGGCRFVSFIRTSAPPTEAASLEEIRTAYAHVAHAPELRLVPTTPPWQSRARFHDRVAARLRQERVLLVGDAAHVWAPIGGHGMNVGLLGAQNLAWRLAAVVRDGAREMLLDGYEREHRALARGVIWRLMFNRTEYPSPGWLLGLIDAAMPWAVMDGPVWRRIEVGLSLLSVRHSAPGASWTLSAAKPGARLPYGRQKTHDLLDPRRWTVLLVDPDAQAQRMVDSALGPLRRFVVPQPVERRAWRGARGLVLVRPDSHVDVALPYHRASEIAARLAPIYPS
ncbi:MAG: FAD-dependent oxidoreductase [Myxococcaceae bacterium]